MVVINKIKRSVRSEEFFGFHYIHYVRCVCYVLFANDIHERKKELEAAFSVSCRCRTLSFVIK